MRLTIVKVVGKKETRVPLSNMPLGGKWKYGEWFFDKLKGVPRAGPRFRWGHNSVTWEAYFVPISPRKSRHGRRWARKTRM